MSNLEDLTITSRKFGKIEDPFIVPVPRPYVIGLTRCATAEARRAEINRLLAHVQELRDVMAELCINETRAYELGLTLNIHTGELLAQMAYKQGKAKLGSKLYNERKF